MRMCYGRWEPDFNRATRSTPLLEANPRNAFAPYSLMSAAYAMIVIARLVLQEVMLERRVR